MFSVGQTCPRVKASATVVQSIPGGWWLLSFSEGWGWAEPRWLHSHLTFFPIPALLLTTGINMLNPALKLLSLLIGYRIADGLVWPPDMISASALIHQPHGSSRPLPDTLCTGTPPLHIMFPLPAKLFLSSQTETAWSHPPKPIHLLWAHHRSWRTVSVEFNWIESPPCSVAPGPDSIKLLNHLTPVFSSVRWAHWYLPHMDVTRKRTPSGSHVTKISMKSSFILLFLPIYENCFTRMCSLSGLSDFHTFNILK